MKPSQNDRITLNCAKGSSNSVPYKCTPTSTEFENKIKKDQNYMETLESCGWITIKHLAF